MPDQFSAAAHQWVAACLNRNPANRPTYQQLLELPFLADEPQLDVDMVTWVNHAVKFKGSKLVHAAPSNEMAFEEPTE